MSIQDKIVIVDDKGKEQTFNNFQDFVDYIDGFYMPFLPDGFNYRIEKEEA